MMGSVFYFVSKAPQWIDQQDAPHYNDMISGDKGIKLVSTCPDVKNLFWMPSFSRPRALQKDFESNRRSELF